MAEDTDFEFTRSRRRRIVISQPRLIPIMCRDAPHRWADEDAVETYCRACGATRFIELWNPPDDALDEGE